jgi:RNA polymerase sigma factor (sigma-70 family)
VGEAEHRVNELPDVELQPLARGDTDAFWRLWEEHEKYLYRICLRQLGGIQEEAEDALSLLMVKLLDLLPRYTDRIQNLRAWLTRITYNLCIDIRRELNRTRNLESIDELAAIESVELRSLSESPEEAALQQESRRYIYHAIDDLPVKLRLPFLLHHLDDWSYNEIAARLAISPENARKRSQLARAVLHETLEKYLSGTAKHCPHSEPGDLDTCLQHFSSVQTPTPSRQTNVRLVNVVLNSGVEKSFCIPLAHKPVKLYQKIERAMRYTSNHPGGWKKRLELAQLLYEAGEWREAIQEYERVLEKQPGLLHVYLDLGNVLDLMDNKLDSIATYHKALQIVREPASRCHINGMIALRRGHYRKAIKEFQQATQIEPDQVGHWQNLAMVHVLRESPLDAIQSFNETLKIDPRDLDALTHLPRLLNDLGRIKEANRHVDEALILHEENVLLIKSLADYRSQRRLVFGSEGRKTLSLIKNALRLAGEAPEVQESLALFHLCRGEWNEGVAVLSSFAHAHRSCPEAWCYYAKALMQSGDAQAAAEAIRHACLLEPDSWRINLVASEIWSRRGPTLELRRLLENILEKFPERWSSWAKAGWACVVGLGEVERACVLSAHAPQLQPQLADPWFQHSKVLALAGRREEAITAAQVGWRWLPRDEDGWQSVPAALGLAENYRLINLEEREQAWIDEGVRRLPGLIAVNPAEGYFWQGKFLELAGDKAGALQAFTKSLAENLFYPIRQDAEAAISRLVSN